MKLMNVVYATNENYAKLVWISAYSLFKNNKDYSIKLYLISDDISSESVRQIEKLVKDNNGKLTVIDFSEISYGLENAQIFSGCKTTYARLFLPDLIKEKRLLYLDCDTLVTGKLDELWNYDMKDNYVAGVQDMVVPSIRTGIGISLADPYVNAGILLMDIEKMCRDNLQKRFIDYISEMGGKVPCHDQGVINHVCKGKIAVVSAKYNVMTPMFSMKAEQIKAFYELAQYYSQDEILSACNAPSIIHFTAGWYLRPWFSGSKHPYAQLYKMYYNQSPWGKVPMNKGKINKKVLLMKWMYKLLPFKTYVAIAKWKRSH